MTKKHFAALATALREVVTEAYSHNRIESRNIALRAVNSIADICEKANNSFDRGKFYDACDPRFQKGA